MIAFKAAGHNVVPGLCASFDDRDNVIKRQIFRGALLAAILACVMVSRVNVRPAEFYVLKVLSGLYVFQQTKNAGHFDCEADAADLAVIFSQNFNLALIKQAQRPFPGYNVDRFIGCV
jgi:hypothetical protein